MEEEKKRSFYIYTKTLRTYRHHVVSHHSHSQATSLLQTFNLEKQMWVTSALITVHESPIWYVVTYLMSKPMTWVRTAESESLVMLSHTELQTERALIEWSYLSIQMCSCWLVRLKSERLSGSAASAQRKNTFLQMRVKSWLRAWRTEGLTRELQFTKVDLRWAYLDSLFSQGYPTYKSQKNLDYHSCWKARLKVEGI